MAGEEGLEHSAHRGFRGAIKVIMEHLTIWESLKTSVGISEEDLYKEGSRMYWEECKASVRHPGLESQVFWLLDLRNVT